MDFEFLIAYRQTDGTQIEAILGEALNRALEDNLSDYWPETVNRMIRLRHERAGEATANENGESSRYVLLGFTVELPDDTELCRTVVDEFAAALADLAPIFHVVKFEDPVLRAQLASWAEELFDLEMKLRRVLTLIYLH